MQSSRIAWPRLRFFPQDAKHIIPNPLGFRLGSWHECTPRKLLAPGKRASPAGHPSHTESIGRNTVFGAGPQPASFFMSGMVQWLVPLSAMDLGMCIRGFRVIPEAAEQGVGIFNLWLCASHLCAHQ